MGGSGSRRVPLDRFVTVDGVETDFPNYFLLDKLFTPTQLLYLRSFQTN